MSAEFEGRVALVTGAASGIGRAVATMLAAQGARIVAVDVAADIEAIGDDLAGFGVHADVADDEQVAAVVTNAVLRFGALHIVCNVAGVQQPATLLAETTMDDYERVMRVNAGGCFSVMHHSIPHLVDAGGGAIVNVASIGGLVGRVSRAAYAASKAAVIQLTRTAALEYARSGVRVNAVCPGPTMTGMMASAMEMMPEQVEAVAASIPIGRIGTPAELAAPIVFLASAGAAFITGTTLIVDGGLLAGMAGQHVPEP